MGKTENFIPQNRMNKIQIVAAEDFYGDISSQLGGKYVSVKNILSNPNIDPHEYESNVADSLAVAKANIIIKNGLGYDDWMDKLISASPNTERIVITAGDISPDRLPQNPHVWYGMDNIPVIAQQITSDLKKEDPNDSSYYDTNLMRFDQSLQQINQLMMSIKNKYTNTPIGLTETIYLYQSRMLGFNVLTPFAFEKAVSEGNDPPANTVITVNNQIKNHLIKILIYNSQTITPVTSNLQNESQKAGIPVVPVSETMPVNEHYQTWMLNQLNNLDKTLQNVR